MRTPPELVGNGVPRVWLRTLAGFLRGAPPEHLEILRRDAGYALRLFRRSPGLPPASLLTLTVGIGLTSAVFSVIRGVLIRPLPLPDSQRWSISLSSRRHQRVEAANVSPADFLDWQRRAGRVDAMAFAGRRAPPLITVRGSGAGQWGRVSRPAILRRLSGETAAWTTVHCDRLRVAGLPPVAARDLRRAPSPVQPSWRPRVLAATVPGGRRVIGTKLAPTGAAVEIIGVLDPATAPPGWGEVTAGCPRWRIECGGVRISRARTYARLAAGPDLEGARAEFGVIAARLADAFPAANRDYAIRVTLCLRRDRACRDTIWFLFAAGACVLLIACANVVNLLLTHPRDAVTS